MRKILLHGFNREITNSLQEKYEIIWIAHDSSADIEYIEIRDCVIQGGDDEVENKILKYVSKFSSIIYECYSRHHYMKLCAEPTVQYYHRLMMAHIKWATNLLRKFCPDFLIFSNVAHEGYDNVLAIVAKYLNIRVYFFYQTPFAPRFWIYEFSNKGSLLVIKNQGFQSVGCCTHIERYIAQLRGGVIFSYMSSITQAYRFDLSSIIESVIRLKIKKAISMTLQNYKYKIYNRRMDKIVSEQNFNDQKYGYFALHLQPELTTSALGLGIYFDQLTALRKFARECKKRGMVTIVKDNPKQNFSHRDENFFFELSRINNVTVVDRFKDSIEILKHAGIVGTVTGTVGLEALAQGIPVIVYGDAWYRRFSGVFVDEQLVDRPFPKIDFEVFRSELIASWNMAFDGCADEDYFSEFEVNRQWNNKKLTDAVNWLAKKNQ